MPLSRVMMLQCLKTPAFLQLLSLLLLLLLGFCLSTKMVRCQADCSNSQQSPEDCTADQFYNDMDCECQCSEVLDCPDMIFDSSTCLCVCDPDLVAACMSPMEFNSDTCECLCPDGIDCMFPMILNEDTCMCECPDIGCEDNGMVQNPDTCLCECPVFDPPCLLPMIVDPDTCECRCPNAFCVGEQEQNLETCECECPMCPQGQEPTDPDPPVPDCTCRCIEIDCGPGRQQNPDTCECECIPIMCDPGRVQDPETCECVCETIDCPDGRTQNPETCQCDCDIVDCGPDRVQDLNTCSCVCADRECPDRFVQNPRTCQCVCDLANLYRCSHYQFLRLDTCECECILYFLGLVTCKLPGVFDHDSCRCSLCECDDSTQSRTRIRPPRPPGRSRPRTRGTPHTGTRRTPARDFTPTSSASGLLISGGGSASGTPDDLAPMTPRGGSRRRTFRTTPRRTASQTASGSDSAVAEEDKSTRTRPIQGSSYCTCDGYSTRRTGPRRSRTSRKPPGRSRTTKTSPRRSSKRTKSTKKRRRMRRMERLSQLQSIT